MAFKKACAQGETGPVELSRVWAFKLCSEKAGEFLGAAQLPKRSGREGLLEVMCASSAHNFTLFKK